MRRWVIRHCCSYIKDIVCLFCHFKQRVRSRTHGLLWASYHSFPPCAVNHVYESISNSLWVTAHRLWKHEKEERDKVRENLEGEQKRRRRRRGRKVGRLGCSPELFVPSTLLLFLCPRSAVPSSRESAGRTIQVRNFQSERLERWFLFKF